MNPLQQKDIYVYALAAQARAQLQREPVPWVVPARPLLEGLESGDWAAQEMAGLDLGDKRLEARAVQVLQGRWDHPEKSYAQSFEGWTQVYGSYRLLTHACGQIDLSALLAGHKERTLERMAAESLVLLAQDTTSLNYSGLKQTAGLGQINHEGSLGLHLHSTLAMNRAGVPLGVVDAQCWGREPQEDEAVGRNAKSLDQKESARWVKSLHRAAEMARRMPQTTVVEMGDRESGPTTGGRPNASVGATTRRTGGPSSRAGSALGRHHHLRLGSASEAALARVETLGGLGQRNRSAGRRRALGMDASDGLADPQLGAGGGNSPLVLPALADRRMAPHPQDRLPGRKTGVWKGLAFAASSGLRSDRGVANFNVDQIEPADPAPSRHHGFFRGRAGHPPLL